MMSITTSTHLFLVVMIMMTMAIFISLSSTSTVDNSLVDEMNIIEMMKDSNSSHDVELRSSDTDAMKVCTKTIIPDFKVCLKKYDHLEKEHKMCDYLFYVQLCRAEAACEKCDYDGALETEKRARAIIGSSMHHPSKKFNCSADTDWPKSLSQPFCKPAAVSDGEALLILAIIIVVCLLCVCGGAAAYFFFFSPAAKAGGRRGGKAGNGGGSGASSSNGAVIAYPKQAQAEVGPSSGGVNQPQQQQPMVYQQPQQQPMAYQQPQQQPMAYQQPQQQPMAYQQQQPQPMAYANY